MADTAVAMTGEPTRQGRHALRYRFSTSFFGRHFYVALVAGSETRSPTRLHDDGLRRSLSSVVFELSIICLAISLMICLMTGFAVIGLYIVKCAMGIDVFDGPSPFHPIFEFVFGH